MFVVRDSLHLLISLIQDIKGTESKFLPFMCCLRFFEIDVDLNDTTLRGLFKLLMGSLCISLTSPATLEHLKFNFSFCGFEDSDGFYDFYRDFRDVDVWSHLDSFASHPTQAGSQLQRVDINIDYTCYFLDGYYKADTDTLLEAVLDGLPLLRTKGILFVEASTYIN
jgi:hypothetical protein